MRALPLLAALLFVAPARAQFSLSPEMIPPTRAIRELMIEVLEDPKVQVKLGITATQRQLMDMRLSQNTLKFGLKLAKAAAQGENGSGLTSLQLPLENSPANALFPYLADHQIAKLRRLTVANDALAALTTDEVAFAVGLTAAQRKTFDAMRLRHLRAQMNASNPAYRAAMQGFGELTASSKESWSEANQEEDGVARLDRVEKAFDRFYVHIARSIRLDAKAKRPKSPDALATLTPAQRRRFRELQLDPVATATRVIRATKKG
ncbi:hypothetical protein EON82_15895 [bacterium]|nr:MAG: hypothetical protein EON82_15895 [bacterium]